jgi:hypothetical protein
LTLHFYLHVCGLVGCLGAWMLELAELKARTLAVVMKDERLPVNIVFRIVHVTHSQLPERALGWVTHTKHAVPLSGTVPLVYHLRPVRLQNVHTRPAAPKVNRRTLEQHQPTTSTTQHNITPHNNHYSDMPLCVSGDGVVRHT